nr:hypothetical protein CFP56_01853 [Quercus suber]
MGVVGCNQIGLSLNKKKWRGLQTTPCGLGIAQRTSSFLGGSRMRSVLGGLVLDGDDLDGDVDELPAATIGAISPVLGATRQMLLSIKVRYDKQVSFLETPLEVEGTEQDKFFYGMHVPKLCPQDAIYFGGKC